MFLRFNQENAIRTVDLNHVTQIHKTKNWGSGDLYSIRIDLIGNHAIVADQLTIEQADVVEKKILDSWTQKRDQVSVLEIMNESQN